MEDFFVSVIVPCYNEEQVICNTHSRIKKVLTDAGINNHELIFVNDGSKDSTFRLLSELSKSDVKTKIVSLSRNFGHQPAITAGINNCSGDIAIIIDADLQDPPELFPDMIKKYQEEMCNVVYGVRIERQGETFFKKISSKWFYKFLNYLSDTDIPKDAGDFRLIDKLVISEFQKLGENNKFIRGLISWIGFHQVPFYYNREERFAGNTKYPLRKMLKFATTGILYFSKKPLQIAVSVGLVCTIVSMLLLFYVLWSYFFSDRLVGGWSSTILIIIFFSGIQLTSLGLVAHYIASIFDEVKKRPEYIVHRKINF